MYRKRAEFCFVLAQRDTLLATAGYARSVSLDLLAQWKGFQANGQFRFTSPTHVLWAFHQALQELEAEGGVTARASRYRQNYDTLMQGMRQIGFEAYLALDYHGYIITSFRGKVSDADCFRIGTIGRIFQADIANFLAAIREH